ncbi:hypothetical protein DUI87_17851 [Hirundo rustica rustica]|uniref:Uncharacterized protein n=1 Tax=Hirundo rustica rustica TaxID=333673 RepID=A0A3M0JWX6_HIRRU|nr:hypothetical protein DUI87_17851 [Hirundo rustica rustica]
MGGVGRDLKGQVAATHSNCIIKKEQETCLEKIRRATALNPLNDSSPGHAGGQDYPKNLNRDGKNPADEMENHRLA